jgi:hypothetical protein
MRQLAIALLLFPAVLFAEEPLVIDAIVRRATPEPRSTCGSTVACSTVAAIASCDCRFDPGANRVMATASLRLLGTIWYFSGPFESIAQRPRDHSVVNQATAIRHEYAFHIVPAVSAVSELVASMQNASFRSIAECVLAGNALAATVHAVFQRTLAETQLQELVQFHLR